MYFLSLSWQALLLSHSTLLKKKKKFVLSITTRGIENNIFCWLHPHLWKFQSCSSLKISILAIALETADPYHENVYEISDFSAHDTDVVRCLGVLTQCPSPPAHTEAVHIFHSKHPLFWKTKVKIVVNSVWDQLVLVIVAQPLNVVWICMRTFWKPKL